jgi:ATP-dependent Clp protease protease subunit
MDYMNNSLDFYTEFKNYATKHMGVSGYQFDNWENLQNTLYSGNQTLGGMIPNGSLTPYILEEREMRVTQMDIFSRMMMNRILWIAGPVNDRMSTIVQAQLMFLDDLDNSDDITMHIDSPGGSVKSGLSMVDVMNYISSDIKTINTGMAASMGSILLGAGTKGKRFSLPNSKVMLHQVSAGASGNISDMRISMNETEKYNETLFDMLADYTGKTRKQVLKDADRDLWLSADEAEAYGIIDGVVRKK